MPAKATSRVQVVLHPPLPATCCVCGRSANGNVKFLDWNVNLDYYGAVLICEDCGREMLDILDFAPVAQIKYRDEQIKNLVLMNRELKEENDRVRAALDAILAVRPDLRSDTDSNDDVDHEDVEQPTKRGTSKK